MVQGKRAPMQTLPEASDLHAIERATLDALNDKLETVLFSRRWFADKDRRVTNISLADWLSIPADDGILLLSIIDIEFATGPIAAYALPLFVHPGEQSLGEAFASFTLDGQPWTVTDGVNAQLGASLLAMITAERTVDTRHGAITGICDTQLTTAQRGERATPSTAEQSNSSLFYETMIAKVYRKLMPGENPDVETGRVLATSKSFASIPRLLGSLEYRSPRASYTLAMLQTRISSPQDGWGYLLHALKSNDKEASTIGTSLGELTARMHIALSRVVQEPAFRPEPTSEYTIGGWKELTLSSASQVVAALQSKHTDHAESVAGVATEVLERTDVLVGQCAGYESLASYPLIRVHGDYHLGQVLRDDSGMWWVVDFEGEPRRSIAERAQKTSPLKDVAGMLRSFSYAGGVARREGIDPLVVAAWEQQTRADFLRSYRTTIHAENPHLLPADDAALHAALRAWELDKALYEVLYELSSRPEWLWLPLGAVAAMARESAG